jgi:hypothetical protein
MVNLLLEGGKHIFKSTFTISFKKTKHLTTSVQSKLNNFEKKNSENYVSNLTEQDIGLKLKELLKNEIKLHKEKKKKTSSLKEHSVRIIQAQKRLISFYWNYVMGNRSFNDFQSIPLQEVTNKKIEEWKKAADQIE